MLEAQMMDGADRDAIWRMLLERRLPQEADEIQRLASALPHMAEHWAVHRAPEADTLRELLDSWLWPLVHDHASQDVETGWASLVAAYVEVSELLGLTPSESMSWQMNRALQTGRSAIQRPRVYALLSDRAPARVLLDSSIEVDQQAATASHVQRCRQLAASLLGWPHTPAWRLANARVEDDDTTSASLLLRLAAEIELPARLMSRPIGITGALDEEGRLLPVIATLERVRSFFLALPDGICLVPAASWKELERELRPLERWTATSDRRLPADQWRHVVPVTSMRQLLVCLGHDRYPEATLISRLREQARFAFDWRGQRLPTHELIELSLRPDEPDRARTASRRDDELSPRAPRWALADVAAHLRNPDVRGVILTGLPGSGKSMELARLCHELNSGELALDGPALLVRARRLTSGGSLLRLLVPKLANLDEMLALPDWRRHVWLLVDGLDELPSPDRRRLLTALQEWHGRLVIATRRLRPIETLPNMTTLVIDALDSYQRDDLLRHLRLEDLVQGPAKGPASAAHERLWQDLGTTPLGVSLLAVAFSAGASLPEQRTELLHGAILHLLARAEHEDRISGDAARAFERRGERYAGAGAWHMLRAGRAILRLEDLDWAAQALKLQDAEERLLRDALDASGFVQRIGADEREFSHKSFAEHCAAVFLSSEKLLPDELWRRIGDPAIDEVVIHLAALAPNANDFLRRLHASRERPMSSLALAMRLLLECRQEKVDISVVTVLLVRRLMLLTRFRGAELPMDLGRPGNTWQVLERWSRQLAPHTESLLAACHEDVQAWLREDQEGDRGPYDVLHEHRARTMAEHLHRHLRCDVPLRNLLRFAHHRDELARWKRNTLLQALEPLLDDSVSEIQVAARSLWVEVAPLARLLPELATYLNQSSVHGNHGSTILRRVTEEGTPLQQREALVRSAVARHGFSFYDDLCESYRQARLGDPAYATLADSLGRPALTAEEWLALWPWAWRTGMLGVASTYGYDLAEEALYARFVHDDIAEARWRALVALGHLHGKTEGHFGARREFVQADASRVATSVRPLLLDPIRAVRMEAIRCLHALGEHPAIDDVLALCGSIDDHERWLAWHAAILAGLAPSCIVLADVLVPRSPRPPHDWRTPGPAETPIDATMKSHGQEARRALIEWAGNQYADEHGRRQLYDLLNDPKLAAVAEETLQGWWRTPRSPRIPLAELRNLLHTGHTAQRQWVADYLTRDEREAAVELLRLLQKDEDPQIAAKAREQMEHRAREAHVLAVWQQSVEVPVQELSISTIRGFGGYASKDPQYTTSDKSFRIDTLTSFTAFETLWEALREHPLSLESWDTIDYIGRDDKIEHIDILAERAFLENRKQVSPIAAKLQTLYEPKHRPLLLRDIAHPLVGFWAELLLADQPMERDLLLLVRGGEPHTVRVARIARGTDLAPAVSDAIIAAAREGILPPPQLPRDEHRQHDYRWRQSKIPAPAWLEALIMLSPLEGPVQLLDGNATEGLKQCILGHLDREREKLQHGLSAVQHRRLLAVLRQAAGMDSESTGSMALRLLGVFGEPSDAEEWAGRLGTDTLSEQTTLAALELIAGRGSAEHAPLLRRLARSGATSSARAAALSSLAQHGDESDAEWLFSLLRPLPPAELRDSYRRPREPALALEGIVRLGNREQAHRLAAMLLADADQRVEIAPTSYWTVVCDYEPNRMPQGFLALDEEALAMASRHGRLPEHALLILGALLHDPGDQDYGVNIDGYDEAMTRPSPIPDQAREALAAVLACCDPEEVRRAFLHRVLAGGPSAKIARTQLDGLGGVHPGDKADILACLEHDPCHPDALALSTRLDDVEQAIATIWETNGIFERLEIRNQDAMQDKESALRELLRDAFDGDADGLRQWVRLALGREIHHALPDGLSLLRLSSETVQAIQSHGRADRSMFESLLSERPSLRQRIQEVAVLWGAAVEDSPRPSG